jgi:mono/diheme cytochrome c family protein
MIAVVLSGIATLLSSGAVQAQPKTDLGKTEYYSKCAVCHGLSGKGEGSFGEVLKVNMPDLTLIAKRNGGVFPVDRVKMAIDGRATPRAHGTSEMPIWGTRYSVEAAPRYDDFRSDSEAFVQVRVLALVDYLYRLQAR